MPPRTRKSASRPVPRRLVDDRPREPRQDDFVLNLDELESDRSAGEFSVVLGGRKIVFLDAKDVDWQDLYTIGVNGAPHMWLQCITTKEDYDYICSRERLEGWKFEKMLADYQDHFGIDTSGNAAASRS